MKVTNFFRQIRNKVTGVNVIQGEINVLRDMLDDSKIYSTGQSVSGLDKINSDMQKLLDSINDTARVLAGKKPGVNASVRIAFVFQHSSIWPVWRNVFSACMENDKVVVDVVLVPFFHMNSSTAIIYDDMRQLLVKEGVSFYTSEYYDLDQFQPDVVFLQNPYDETRPSHLRVKELLRKSIRIAYIPYGLEMGGGSWNLTSQFDLPVQRGAWRIFARSDRHLRMFSKYCQSGSGHVVVTGHPKFDSTVDRSDCDIGPALKEKINGRKVLLWTPHFAVGDPPTWSTYRIYSDIIFEYMRNKAETFLLIRPHPLFFRSMQQNKIWDSEGENRFRGTIEQADNIALDESVDYLPAFSIADALMADVGSFLLEFLPTGKPLLYLHHPEGLGMNDDEDLVESLYKVSNPEQIPEFIDMIFNGEDPKRSMREAAIKEFLFGLDGNAGRRICDHIVSALNSGDVPSPSLFGKDELQLQSDAYWSEAENTYLAPKDYYDKREELLRDMLHTLPSLNNILDIGCGDGRFTRLFAQFATHVTAYDLSPALIEKARVEAKELSIDNIEYRALELEEIKPLKKYNLVACMGVTSCMVDDIKFLRILDRFKSLVRTDGYLLMVDTLSTVSEQTASDESGYVAKYRNVRDYCKLIDRRGFHLKEEIVIKAIEEKALVNKLFLFTYSPETERGGD